MIRMSLLPLKTYASPGVPLFGSGGGGGGGSTIGANLVVSTLTAATQVSTNYLYAGPTIIKSLLSQPAAGNVVPTYGAAFYSDNGANIYSYKIAQSGGGINDFTAVSTATGYFGLRTEVDAGFAKMTYNNNQSVDDGASMSLNLSTLSMSGPSTIEMVAPTVLINGSLYPPAAPSFISTLAVSSFTASTINGAIFPPPAPTAISAASVSGTSTMITPQMESSGDLLVRPADGAQMILKTKAGASQASQLVITDPTATNSINFLTNNTTTSLIYGNPSLQISSVTTLNDQVPMGTFSGTQMAGGFQSGYVAGFPYASTLLFPHPYPDDKVCVVFTPTNAGVGGGNNPNFSLAAGFGLNGVSSIGFSTDFRNGGVGAASDFYWMAYPWTN